MLSVLTEDYVAQVSDMRLTAADGSAVSEEAAKTVVWDGRFLVGYTGFACSEGESTDKWLASVLADKTELEPAVESVRSEAERRAAALPGKGRHLAVGGVGWGRRSGADGLVAMWFEVSNIDIGGAPAPGTFTGTIGVLRTPFLIRRLGQALPTRARIERQVRGRIRAGSSAGAVVQTLARCIREVASTNPTVGHALLLSSIPRAVAPLQQITIRYGPLDWNNAELRHAPGDPRDAIVRGPTFAIRGLAAAGIVMGAEDELRSPDFVCPPA